MNILDGLFELMATPYFSETNISIPCYKIKIMKRISPTRFLAILLFTFGITYLEFDNLTLTNNIRPYIMLLIGLLVFLYSFKRSK